MRECYSQNAQTNDPIYSEPSAYIGANRVTRADSDLDKHLAEIAERFVICAPQAVTEPKQRCSALNENVPGQCGQHIDSTNQTTIDAHRACMVSATKVLIDHLKH